MTLLTLLVLLVAGCFTEGAKILAVFPFQGRSHNVMFEPLMMGLARAGHLVDVVSHFPPEKPVPGFNHISLKGSLHFYVNNMTASTARSFASFYASVDFMSYREPKDLCNLMRLPQLQNIINTETKYDVMMVEIFGTNCYLAVAHKLKLPVIGIVSATMYPWAYDPFLDSDNPSYIPSLMAGLTFEMGFIERLQNLFIHLTSKLLFYYYDKTVSEPLARKYVNDFPSLNEIYFNMSLALVNSHHSINGVRTKSPAVIEVAGLHIDETQQLTEELDSFLNSSKDGVVFFSMGSMVKSETFPIENMKAIYDSFAELTNYKVLWKGKVEEMPEGLPSNVKMIPWVPQYAILRHPKVKAFVTHGGLMGTQEAIHAGVPMIGIPFFSDQMFNIRRYALQGFAICINYEKLTKASFSSALRELLTNPKYQSNIERASRLYKDRPLSPMDEAIYWIEYVIRNGGESLRSSARHLNWFQYHLIDVGLFLMTTTTLVLIVVFMIVRRMLVLFAVVKRYTYSMKVKTT